MLLLKKKLRCYFVCSMFLCTLIPICSFIIANIEIKHQREQAQRLSEFVDKIVSDVSFSLNLLNATNAVNCNTNLIEEMHKVLIKAHFVKEAGFIQNDQIICSTSQGITAKPQPKFEMDFDTGRGIKIYVDIPLNVFENSDAAPRVLIAEGGSFYVAVDRSYIQLTGLNLREWEVVHKFNGAVHHIYGQFGVFDVQRHEDNQSKSFFDTGLYTSHCNDNNHYCASTITTWPQLLFKFKLLISIMVLAGIISLHLLVMWLYPFKHKEKSLSYRVKNALKNKTFDRVYQPIVELNSEEIVGFEMLSRLEDEHGTIYPDQFIPLIKEAQLTWEFTVTQLLNAKDEISTLSVDMPIKLNFNIFPEDLNDKHVSQLIEICTTCNPNITFNVEIIEDKILDTEKAVELIAKLNRNNLLVSIDDFGTGYSNLSKLNDFHCDYLKIDREFIANIESSSLLSTLVPQIKHIAQRFGLKTVAEGIENAVQKEILADIGIEYGQGWYFGKPRPIDFWRKQIIAQESFQSKQLINGIL